MIKASDRKPTNAAPASYAETSEPALGIAFEQRGGRKRFVPYPLLSAVDYDGKNELTFHFGAERIIAKGENLEPLWMAVCKGQLEWVRESERPAATIAWVRELVLADSEAEHNLPPFPT